MKKTFLLFGLPLGLLACDQAPPSTAGNVDAAPSADAASVADVNRVGDAAPVADAAHAAPEASPMPDAALSVDAGAPDLALAPDAVVVRDAGAPARGVVHVVLFTHIEDNTPRGPLGSMESRLNYVELRTRMIELAQRMRMRGLPWVLQPDWKYLEAARMYEDARMMANTNDKNVFRYLREDLGVAMDPHSHENGGYNYTDVAHLLELLGVGGSTIIGGHIWDPALPMFQQWDRFRVPVAGERYPEASWRGDQLIGAGTPNHVNDPIVSGMWRPQDRDNYFTDDPSGNIMASGAWRGGVPGVQELIDLYARGTVPANTMLTASWNLRPMEITAAGGIDTIDEQTLMPLEAMQDAGNVLVTDFTTLGNIWRTGYGATGEFYRP